MAKLTVKRGIISPELAAKHYPGIEYKIIKAAAQKQIRATATRKAAKRGVSIEKVTIPGVGTAYQPAGYKTIPTAPKPKPKVSPEIQQQLETYDKFGVYFVKDIAAKREAALKKEKVFATISTPGGLVMRAGEEYHPEYQSRIQAFKKAEATYFTREKMLKREYDRLLGLTTEEKKELAKPPPLTAAAMKRIKAAGKKDIFAEFGTGALLTPLALEQLTKPVAWKAIGKIATTPGLWKATFDKAVYGTVREFKEEPARFFGGLAASAALFKGIGGVVGKVLPKPSISVMRAKVKPLMVRGEKIKTIFDEPIKPLMIKGKKIRTIFDKPIPGERVSVFREKIQPRGFNLLAEEKRIVGVSLRKRGIQKQFTDRQIKQIEKSWETGMAKTEADILNKIWKPKPAPKAPKAPPKPSPIVTAVTSGKQRLILGQERRTLFEMDRATGIDTVVAFKEVPVTTRFTPLESVFGKPRKRLKWVEEEQILAYPPGTMMPGALPSLALASATVLTQQQRQYQAQLSQQSQLQKQLQSQSLIQLSGLKQSQKQAQAQLQKQLSVQKTAQTTLQKQLVIPVQILKYDTALEQALVFKIPYIKPKPPPPIPKPYIKPKPPIPIPIPSLFPRGKGIFAKPKKQAGFDVFAKVLGRRKKLASNVPKRSAFSIGSQYADTTPAASFRMVKTGKPTKKSVIPGWDTRKHKFTKGKTFPMDIVEKKKYRIDSLGEMLGLAKAKKAGGFRNKKGKFDMRDVL